MMSKSTNKKSPKMKFKKAPGAPKRFKSAFLFFSEYKHKQIREEARDRKIRAAEAAKVVSQSWKALSDEERAPWLEMGRVDRERYEREKAAYKGPWKIPDIKDPNAPKKPMSAFLAFGNERRGLIAEANPTLTNTEISSLLSKLWKECPAHMKQAYRDREARERAEFKKNFAEWERKREEALVMDHNSINNSETSAAGDETSVTTSQLEESQLNAKLPQQEQIIQALPPMGFWMQPQQRSLDMYQSVDTIPEDLPADLFMPMPWQQHGTTTPSPAMISDEAMDTDDSYLAQEAWPFDHRVPKVIALPPATAASSSRFANYSMDDILQDEELFFEDFSPLQVISFTQQQQQP